MSSPLKARGKALSVSSDVSMGDEAGNNDNESKKSDTEKEELYKVSKMRLLEYSKPETMHIIVGCLAAACNGALMPLLSLPFAEMLAAFYLPDTTKLRNDTL